MSQVIFVGVRHHSPACARVVAAVLAREKPDLVLIEGPSDFNDRIGLFALKHTPPVALFAYVAPDRTNAAPAPEAEDAEDHLHAEPVAPLACFYPFAAHSPEWVALRAGIPAHFIDLPSYRARGRSGFSDGPLPASAHIGRLARKLGFDDFDSLWDHLFECEEDPEKNERALERFFDAFRGDERGNGDDADREAFMASQIAQRLQEASTSLGRPARAVVVTGGFHTPALRSLLARDDLGERGTIPPPPANARVGIDLVPYSFPRLDALRGYASGMPGPQFYATLWEHGPAKGAEETLFSPVKALRPARSSPDGPVPSGGKVPLSPADAIALATAAEGLRRMRAHSTLSRSDLLDAVRVALVKEDVLAPHGPEMHPILAAVEEHFRGDRRGTVDPATPRPPLLRAVDEELQALGLVLGPVAQEVPIDPAKARDRARAVFLQRLLLLGIPGISWTRPRLRASGAARFARFRAVRGPDFEPALLEASAYGATVATAASAFLEERAATVSGAKACAEAVAHAWRAELPLLGGRLLPRLQTALSHEGDLGELGAALSVLLDLMDIPREQADDGPPLEALVAAALDRGLWLFEASRLPPPPVAGGEVPSAPRVHRSALHGVFALRRAEERLAPATQGPLRALLTRYVHDDAGLPGLRGAALAWLMELSARDAETSERELGTPPLLSKLKLLLHPATVGDVLEGLFIVGREALREVPALLALLDDLLEPLGEEAFLVALPALRAAFGGLTPRERRRFAEGVVARRGGTTMDLLDKLPQEGALLAAISQENAIFSSLSRYGLLKA